MDSGITKRLVLPAVLVVTTYVSATSCRGEKYCADIESRDKCDEAEGCGWSDEYDECINTCFMIQDQMDCEAIDRCEWEAEGGGSGGGSETGGTETGGGGSCHEPFS